jgi:S-formylglutathione hydrolase FrmB
MTTSYLCALALLTCLLAQDNSLSVSDAKKDENGILVHAAQSHYQAGKTEIRVLLPDRLEKGKRYSVIYVLPVEARNESHYGDGLLEVKKHDLANQHRAVFVAPTFSHLPRYADHPSKADIRQETYFLKVVLPLIEKKYPVNAEASGRLLLGFRKSGWGAFSLLLRHPEFFGKAAAWDAPLMMDQPNRYGMGEIFGTQENFEKYQITKLLERRADELREGKRLILLGYGNFRDHHQKAHAVMDKLKISHDYRDGPAPKHEWSSGWVPEAVRLILVAPKDSERP